MSDGCCPTLPSIRNGIDANAWENAAASTCGVGVLAVIAAAATLADRDSDSAAAAAGARVGAREGLVRGGVATSCGPVSSDAISGVTASLFAAPDCTGPVGVSAAPAEAALGAATARPDALVSASSPPASSPAAGPRSAGTASPLVP